MAKQGQVTKNLEKLGDLIESLKKTPVLEVGVFGAKGTRKEDKKSGPSNADLAAAHEYGVPQMNIPSRSMLRVPLKDHSKEIMEAVKGRAEDLITKTGVKNFWNLIGAQCLKIVEGAFATGGYGKWEMLKYATQMAKLKGSLKKRKATYGKIYAGQVGGGILIDTGELRKAFNWRVKFKF